MYIVQHLQIHAFFGEFEKSIRIRRVSHALRKVTEFGWPNYLRLDPRPSYSLSEARKLWSPRQRVRYDVLTDRTWLRGEFVARPLSQPWAGKPKPTMAISPLRLVVAAGSLIYSYKFVGSNLDAPPVRFEGSRPLFHDSRGQRDASAIAFVPDGGLHRTLRIAYLDGTFEQIRLVFSNNGGMSIDRSSATSFQLPGGDFVESLSLDTNYLLSLSSRGSASLTDHTCGDSFDFHTIQLERRSWASHLCMQSGTPYAAFGTSSRTPLILHAITNSHLSPTPLAVLHAHPTPESPMNNCMNAVYGITRAPPSSPWGSSPQILVSGWYDGQVRCYDLRSSSRFASDPTTPTTPNTPVTPHSPAPLRPVLRLDDPWSYEPIYSVSCGGGSASYIAGGSARHSVVSFWDVRIPSAGWSVHAPHNDRSPVYQVILESSRLFAATESRPFVYDFVRFSTRFTCSSLQLTNAMTCQ